MTETQDTHEPLFPDVDLEKIMSFEDPIIAGLRATREPNGHRNEAWLGTALCAVAAGIGPEVWLELSGKSVYNPNFNVLLAAKSSKTPGFHTRIFDPFRELEAALKGNPAKPLDTISVNSLDAATINHAASHSYNGSTLVTDLDTPILRAISALSPEDQEVLIGALRTTFSPSPVEDVKERASRQSLNLLLSCKRDQLPQLAGTALFRPTRPLPMLVLPDNGRHVLPLEKHECAAKLQKWKLIMHMILDDRKRSPLLKPLRITPCDGAMKPVVAFQAELKARLQSVDELYLPFLRWLPLLAVKLAIVTEMLRFRPLSRLGVDSVNHAVEITKWLANCHYLGLHEVFMSEGSADGSEMSALTDMERQILTKLRQKGPLTARQLARSFHKLSVQQRDFAVESLMTKQLVVWTPDSRLMAASCQRLSAEEAPEPAAAA